MIHLSLLKIHRCVLICISDLWRIVLVVQLVFYVRKEKFNNYLLVSMRFKGKK